jgi:hypothetical protein
MSVFVSCPPVPEFASYWVRKTYDLMVPKSASYETRMPAPTHGIVPLAQ